MESNKLNINHLLSPQMQNVLKIQAYQSSNTFTTQNNTVQQIRDNYTKERHYWNKGGVKMDKIINTTITGRHGEIPIRFYYPTKTNETIPCIVYIHGGGFLVGNLDTHDRIMRNLSFESQAVVVGVDYRLSPEYKFPIALEDCADLILYLHHQGKNHGINSDTISLSGDSGGANLALAVTLYLRETETNISYIKSLLLYYGFYGLRDSISQRLYGGEYDGLSQSDLEYYKNLYLPSPEYLNHPYYAPLEADLNQDLPPCYLETGDLDPLRDNSIVLYEILHHRNIPCELVITNGLIHAYLHYSKVLDEALNAIKRGATFYTKYR
ncbi:MAG: acetyl esterase [Brevinema sp.]